MTAKMLSHIKVLISDPVMAKLVDSHDPPRIGKNPIFFSLVRAIVSQQLSEAAASTIFGRSSAITEISPDTLSVLDVAAFRSCGISFRKANYIKGIAEAASDGEISHIADLNDDDAIKALVKLKGVGRWTAEMIFIFSLGREDIWPVDDAGLLRVCYGWQRNSMASRI